MANLAATYHKLGRYQEAEPLESIVLEKRKQVLGADHPDTLLAMDNLAATYRELGRYQEAEYLEAQYDKLVGNDIVIETRTPPHIKHKQEAVSPIQFFSSSRPKLARSLPRPLTGRTLPTCSKHDGRLLWCLLYLHSLCRHLPHLHAALVSSAFRYVPFQTMSRCLSCRGKGAAADDDDFDPMKFPAANSAFTPDGERIHPYTSSLPMQVRAPPPPHPQPTPRRWTTQIPSPRRRRRTSSRRLRQIIRPQ
ncbi:hypothetical protein B0H13DRAFT_2444706 [Mycena leptocephala]|nr:hypothetical protein B0H13DRAFT_2444706 [Mycena leptocephala]